MRAGRHRTRFELQGPVDSRDADGGTVTTYRKLGHVWGDLVPQGSREFLNAQAINAQMTAMIKIRYQKNVTSRHRLKLGNRIFNIDGPPLNTGSRNIELALRCIEEEETE